MQVNKVYVDLDGVIADFDRRVKEVTGLYPKEQNIGKMWKQLSRPELDFYYTLPFMPDGKELWDYVKSYEPTIITGCPMGNWAPGQKKRWVGDMLGWHVPCITCMARDKPQWSGPGHVLIDDRPEKAKDGWEQAGGVFITHTSTEATIKELKALGL